MRDLYQDLEVKPDATPADIKAAFRRLTLEHHPDRNVDGSDERFKQVSHAYEVLSDPELRRSYDKAQAAGSSKFGPALRDFAMRMATKLWQEVLGEVPELGRLTAAFTSGDKFEVARAGFDLAERLFKPRGSP